jgi:3'-phosphoadenosine 5'-phosphosulfate sulfotransferase (PAPS reductase)/FAD synthetase
MSKYVASVSFGKDSLAMLLLILEHNLPLDEVVFYDTGMEFQAIYNIRDKILPILKQKNIIYTELKPKMKFEDMMFNNQRINKKGELKNGYGWCGGLCRWGTTYKTQAINNYLKGDIIQYVGIAVDEKKRLERLKGTNKNSPLAQFGYTEKMALDYCYSKGFNWLENGVELYSILDRVSCWCCRNKNLKELKNYKKYLPNYFKRLQELEVKINEPMKKPKYLSERFNEVTSNE